MVPVVRKCPFTGELKTRELDVTHEELHAWRSGRLIQDALPRLNTEEREFVLTGIDGDAWERHVASGDDQ